jgi:uncharacterized protein
MQETLEKPSSMKRRSGSGASARTKLIVNLTRGRTVCVSELADRPVRRARGLLGRSGLPAGEGLLLSPAPGIHTAFMRFPIDALFLDRNMRVIDIVENLQPWRMASRKRARAVLELTAGESARCGVRVGDELELRDRRAGAAEDAVVSSVEHPPALNGSTVTRIRPLRILVVSKERHFGTVMSLLLTRRNCTVVASGNRGRLGMLIARECPDVVVLEVDDSFDADPASVVEGITRPVGVVLVRAEGSVSVRSDAALPMWGPFADIVTAVERAAAEAGEIHARR